ncbi:MAG: ATPase [Prevotella sp.]
MILIADSGSTKTDWVLAEDGKIKKSLSTQGINPFHQDCDTIGNIVSEELLPQIKDTEIDALFFYGSGCREEFVPVMTSIFDERFASAKHIEVHGDLLGAARALCGKGEGIACILGTGANSCLYDGKDISKNTPPLGYILGDEGSGAVLGKLFVNAIFKKQLPDDIRDKFLSEYNLTQSEIIHRVYREPLANRFLASFARFIAQHLELEPLRQLVIDNFRSFFRLNLSDYECRHLPVGAVGSIAFYFAPEFKEAARLEGYRVGHILRSPIEGLLEYHSEER